MNVKAYLHQVKKLDRLIQNKLIEVEQWKSIATGTSVSMEGERVLSSGNKQRMSDAITRYIAIQQEIDRDIDILVDTKRDVIRTIEQLPLMEYDVLHKVYIQYKNLHDVADEYDKSYQWVIKVHGIALKHLQLILDERKKESEEE